MSGMIPGKPWRRPVSIEIEVGSKSLTVANAREAAHLLLNLWPSRECEVRAAALVICEDVIAGFRGPETARDAFVEAARAAGLKIQA